jgi:uncharacterized membrane protein
LVEPHSKWFCYLSSVAAPLFITLSGVMISFSQQRKDYPFGHFLRRGLVLIGIAAVLDITAWQMYPFTSFDVLYIIGISAPIAYFFGRIRDARVQWLLVGVVFLLAPLLQYVFGYTEYPSEFNFGGTYNLVVENQTSILNHLFIDGWFPVFPWLGFSLLGVLLGNYRWKGGGIETFSRKITLLIATALLVVGVSTWLIKPVTLYSRDGFSEVFYPPTLRFCVYTIGIILVLFYLTDKFSDTNLLRPVSTIGQSSLFLYILHTLMINYVLSLFFERLRTGAFLILWFCFSVFIAVVAYGLKILKEKWNQPHWILRFLLGG